MKNTTAKEKILKLLRDALINREIISTSPADEAIFAPLDDEPLMIFGEKFSSEKGCFMYCYSEDKLLEDLKSLAQYRQWTSYNTYTETLFNYLSSNGLTAKMADSQTKVGIILCQAVVAPTGSIILVPSQGLGERLVHFPPTLIVIATTSQLCRSYKAVLNALPENIPQWVLSIKCKRLIQEEIKELRIFLVEA